MKTTLKTIIPLIAILALWLSGCSGESQPKESGPEAMTRADTCHVCGMIVLDQQGPKGQARVSVTPARLNFCSTSDLMAFLFQPDSRTIVREAWVHNMHGADWQSPPNRADAYLNAFEAWYVLDHDRRGAMGHTLAPFASQAQAEAFVAQHGGRVLRFDEIDMELIVNMASYAFPDVDSVRDFNPEVELGGDHHHH